MKYCKNGNHRFHLRPKLVEQLNGDSGWLCLGAKGWTRKTLTPISTRTCAIKEPKDENK